MKKTNLSLAAVLLIFVLAMSGCSSKEPTAAIDLTGYTQFVSEEKKIIVNYPQEWILLNADDSETLSGEITSFMESAQMDKAMISQLKESDINVWYMTRDTSHEFLANTNLVVTDASGLSQKILERDDVQKQLSESMIQQVKPAFPDVKLAQDPELLTLGKESFLMVTYTYTIQNFQIKGVQGLTVKNKQNYIFTMTALADEFDAWNVEFQTVLSALEFNK